MGDTPASPTSADQYRHDDGTVEVVFEFEDGRVLTVREYPDVDTFDEHVEDATYVGEHEGVAALPGVEAFEDFDV